MSTARLDLCRLENRLKRLYDTRSAKALALLRQTLERFDSRPQSSERSSRWDQTDVVLIAYGDQVRTANSSPLAALRHFLLEFDLPSLINTIHFLPCFPYSSDDGFSVIDYYRIDENLGSWEDISEIGKSFHLMFDFVVNHVSQESDWFKSYLGGEQPFVDYFIEADPGADVSLVTRPRSLPLLSEFSTNRGSRWLWTTFSRDQIDLNYAEPAVLANAVEVLLHYVSHGARIIRLDAIAYLWKQLGTSCIHLPQTHEFVKILRDVLDALAPHVLLLTETNVPHEENVSYFGEGDEAHMVYQFSLPPLLLDAFLHQDAEPLKNWLAHLASPPPGAAYFNFTASHDGIGVRPLEGHVDDARLRSLVGKIESRGGMIGSRRQSDGTDVPYELNISYVDALAPREEDVELHCRRFLTSQAVMLALQGIPAVYFHSLVGGQNDYAGVESSGIPRRINRRKFALEELVCSITGPVTLQLRIFEGMREMLKIRVMQPAFHPNASQQYVESGSPRVLCFSRSCSATPQEILVAANFGDTTEAVVAPARFHAAQDLLTGSTLPGTEIHLHPAQIAWLEARS